MKRRVGVIGAAVVCALLGVQAGTGSASAVAGGRGVPGSAAVAATDDPAGFPYVGSAGAEAGSGTRPAGRAPGGTR
ncbi:hypothetical protein ACFV45_06535, partial [Streptomyces sp. NPDC059809]